MIYMFGLIMFSPVLALVGCTLRAARRESSLIPCSSANSQAYWNAGDPLAMHVGHHGRRPSVARPFR